MATVYDLAGTTSKTFTIGDNGITIFSGVASPNDDMGKVGDIYVQTLQDYDTAEYPQDVEDYPEYYEETHGGESLPIGFILRAIEEVPPQSGTYVFRAYLKWNGTTWDTVTTDVFKLGRIWHKEAFNNAKGSRWSFIKTYSFDTPIIQDEETGFNTNDWRISIKSADNGTRTSTSNTDFSTNHDRYGVTRYATTSEATPTATEQTNFINGYKGYDTTAANFPTVFNNVKPDLFIAETPKQIIENIELEMKRAIKVEGTLNDLDNHLVKDDIVSALNSEFSRASSAEHELEEQIAAIIAKRDVVDIVQYYDKTDPTIDPPPAQDATDLVHYDKFTLEENDVVKVLTDETEQNATSYHKIEITPAAASTPTPGLKFLTNADMEAYNKSLLHTGDLCHVKTDELQSNATTYYTFNGTSWDYQGTVTYSWVKIGVESAYYTTIQADSRFVHQTGPDTISGVKTFTGSIAATNAEVTVATQTRGDNSTKAASTAFVADGLSLKVDKTSTASQVYVTDGSSNQTTLTYSTTATASNIVQRDSNGQVVVPQTPTANEHAASKNYVDQQIGTIISVPSYTSANDTQCLAVHYDSVADETSLVWREVKDYRKLQQLDDTDLPASMTQANDGEVLIYDSSAGVGGTGAWKNGYQTVATISYH